MYPVISTIALFFIFFQIQDPIQSRTVHCILMWMSSLLPSFDLEQFHKPFFFFFLLWHWHFWRLQASCCVRYFGLGLFNSLFMIQLKLIVLAKNNSEVMLCPRRITSRGTCCQFISFFADWVKVCVCACVCVCVRACVRACVCVCSISTDSLWPHELQPARLLYPWNFQARILEWIAMSSSGIWGISLGSSWPKDWTCISCVSCIGRCILYHCATWEVLGLRWSLPDFSIAKTSSLPSS